VRIAYLTEEAPLDVAQIATGNQVRDMTLEQTMTSHGVQVIRRWNEDWTTETLADAIDDCRSDAVLLGYWRLLELLHEDLDYPIAVDCVAPRPLEDHFAEPCGTQSFIQRYGNALQRADLIMVGNSRQRLMIAGWLLAAGDDLRSKVPIVVVPPAASAPPAPREDHRLPLVLSAGGKDWPWRDSRRWLHALLDPGLDDRMELHCIGPAGIDHPNVRSWPLMPWGQWREHLAKQAHVGIELAEGNLERELSQSFRSTAFLGAGLPLILNDFLPLADLVRRYDAGWVVASPTAARAALSQAVESPQVWRQKATGAWRLAREALDPRASAKPLLDWLEHPRRRIRQTVPRKPDPAPTASALPRRRNALGWVGRIVLAPFRRRLNGNGVVVISRADLFPTDHGAAVKIIETARGLARQGRPVAIVTAERDHYLEVSPDGVIRRPLPRWLRLLALPRRVSHLLHRLRGMPSSNAFLYWPLYDPGYALRAAWVGRQIDAGQILAEFPAYAHSARLCRMLNGGSAVMVEHNVEYQRLREQISDLGEACYQRFRRIELKLANSMDAVVCVSERDRRTLIDAGLESTRVITIPHGVDLTGFEHAEPIDVRAGFELDPTRPILVYHGTFSYEPNHQALMIIVEEILPRLARLGHQAQVLAIGSHPPKALFHSDLCLAGSLPELAGAIKACDLAIVPLIAGGGTRMKILDYFGAALPVVSTSKGCEGLPVTDGRELLIRDDWDSFAETVARLLEDPERCRELGDNAYRFASALSWPAIAARYDKLFRQLARTRTPAELR